MRYALSPCFMLFTLYSLLSTLYSMPYALCAMLHALCAMRYAPCAFRLKPALPAQLNVFDFLFNRGEIRRLFHRGAALLFPFDHAICLPIFYLTIQCCFFRFFSLLNGLSFNSMQLSALGLRFQVFITLRYAIFAISHEL